MLEIKDVTVRYPGNEISSLTKINLSFTKGEFVCILGQSGAGKSSLIRCVNGLQTPTQGEIIWNGLSLANANKEQLRKIRREMGMIFQHFNLIPRLTVLQNVLTGMFGYRRSFKNLIGWFSADEIVRAEKVITEVGLYEQLNRRVERLSGGQKQRVGIARSILQQPKLLLGDEPVSSLDPGTASHIFSLLKEMHDRHELLTIINVHDVELAKRFATRLIGLKDGEMRFDGKPEEFNEQEFHEIYGSTPTPAKSLLHS